MSQATLTQVELECIDAQIVSLCEQVQALLTQRLGIIQQEQADVTSMLANIESKYISFSVHNDKSCGMGRTPSAAMHDYKYFRK